MPFSPPSDEKLNTMFGPSDDSSSDEFQLTTRPLRHPGASKRKHEPVQDVYILPKKLCFDDEEQKNGYTTPPRLMVISTPSTPFKPVPSTPDDVKMTGDRLPITPGKKFRKEQ